VVSYHPESTGHTQATTRRLGLGNAFDLMREIKQQFDPDLLSPHRFVVVFK